MPLTTETPRIRWLALAVAWLVSGVLIWLHTTVVQDYLRLLDGAVPHKDESVRPPLRQLVPMAHADAQMWVRLALDAADKGESRVRFTTADNAPAGREVHWSSAFMWLVRGAAAAQRLFVREPSAASLERVLLWFNGPLWLIAIVVLSAWTARRAGTAAGLLVGAALLGHKRFYEMFAPTNVDHHGLIGVLVLGMLLGLVFMGAGWRRTPTRGRPAKRGGDPAAQVWLPGSADDARHAAVFSAVCGALGVWLSAASVLPAIALAGIGGLASAWFARNQKPAGLDFDPVLWRWWGRVGAAVTALCYLIEYAPAHLGLRLEVNHPLWSLAWWGGAELVAGIGGGLCPIGSDEGAPPPRWPGRKLILPVVAISAAPFAILFGGVATFMIRDPFVGELRHFVVEGLSIPALAARFGLGTLAHDIVSATLVIVIASLVWRRREPTSPALVTAGVVAIGFVLMAMAESRWCLQAAAAELVLLLGLLAMAPPKPRRIAMATLLAVLVASACQPVVRGSRANQRDSVSALDLMQPLYRDIAATLRASQPEGDIVLLSDPNASATIGYFARCKTIGTLYWENAAGLRAAAAILCARTDEQAAQLVRARDITHVAVIATTNFIAEYNRLLFGTTDRAEVEKSFAIRITSAPPRWLQPIPYRIPGELKSATKFALLFKVAFEQTEVEQLYHAAVALAAAGEVAGAEKTLADAVARAPAEAKFALCESAGNAFYDYDADAAAARAFRRALQLRDDPLVANTLAWILATSSDPAIRDGRAALGLVEPRLRAGPEDPTLLSTFAAACAEVGRFADAVAAAERALTVVRASGDAAAEKLLQQRLAAYRAGRPWRQ